MILIFLYLLISLAHTIRHCHNNQGTSIVYLKIHMDKEALEDIYHYVSSLFNINDHYSAAQHYFGVIIDEVNRKIFEYGVQIQIDLSRLETDFMFLPYDRDSCNEDNVAYDRGNMALKFLESTRENIGNRLIIFSCSNDSLTKESYVFKSRECGSITAIKYAIPGIMIKEIKEKVVGAIVRDKFNFYGDNDEKFNNKLCLFSEKCTKYKENINGVYLDHIILVKNAEEPKIREHECDSSSSYDTTSTSDGEYKHYEPLARFFRPMRKRVNKDAIKYQEKMAVKHENLMRAIPEDKELEPVIEYVGIRPYDDWERKDRKDNWTRKEYIGHHNDPHHREHHHIEHRYPHHPQHPTNQYSQYW